MADTFAEYIQRDRDRLNAEREAIFTQQRELESKLAEINREMAAIDAYEHTKTGKQAASGQRKGSSRRGPSAGRRGSKREALLQLIRDNPSGLGRGDILERMGL